MSSWFDDPMVQSGVAPFAAALLVAAVLARLRAAHLPWLALTAGLLATVLLTTGLAFTPLSASRKVLLLVLVAPLVGLALDLVAPRMRALAPVLALAAGAAVFWIFQSVLAQAEGSQGLAMGGGVALFVAALVGLVLRHRDDGVATGAATLGLGLAVGVSGVLSASIGTLMNGISLAMGAGALLLLQLLRGSSLAAGFTGALTAGFAAALFAATSFLLAEGRWFVLLLLPAVPLVAGLPLGAGLAQRPQLVVRGLATVASALLPIAAAWFATRGGAPG